MKSWGNVSNRYTVYLDVAFYFISIHSLLNKLPTVTKEPVIKFSLTSFIGRYNLTKPSLVLSKISMQIGEYKNV